MAATINTLNNRFVHVSYQAGSTTYFVNDTPAHPTYYVITGNTSSEAALETATLPGSGTVNVVPYDSIAYVTFADGTTAIVTHNELYGKAGAAAAPAYDGNPVKVVDVDIEWEEPGELPGEEPVIGGPCPYQVGDIVVLRSIWSGSNHSQYVKVGYVADITGWNDSGIGYWSIDYDVLYDSAAIDARLKALEDWATTNTSFASAS
jgi:hypothetical protein